MIECLKKEEVFDIYEGYNMAVFVPKADIKTNIRINPYNDFELLYHEPYEAAESPNVVAIFIERNFLQDISKALFNNRNIILQTEKAKLDEDIRGLLELFIKEAKDRQIGYKLILDNLSAQIAINILRQAGLFLIKKQCYTENDNINSVIDHFLENYHQEYSVEDAAKVANLSPYHFIRVFKAETGKTPYEYFMDIKIKNAKEMFESQENNVTEVCFLCGFSNVSHFSTVFKKKVGASPMEYRKLVSWM